MEIQIEGSTLYFFYCYVWRPYACQHAAGLREATAQRAGSLQASGGVSVLNNRNSRPSGVFPSAGCKTKWETAPNVYPESNKGCTTMERVRRYAHKEGRTRRWVTVGNIQEARLEAGPREQHSWPRAKRAQGLSQVGAGVRPQGSAGTPTALQNRLNSVHFGGFVCFLRLCAAVIFIMILTKSQRLPQPSPTPWCKKATGRALPLGDLFFLWPDLYPRAVLQSSRLARRSVAQNPDRQHHLGMG